VTQGVFKFEMTPKFLVSTLRHLSYTHNYKLINRPLFSHYKMSFTKLSYYKPNGQ